MHRHLHHPGTRHHKPWAWDCPIDFHTAWFTGTEKYASPAQVTRVLPPKNVIHQPHHGRREGGGRSEINTKWKPAGDGGQESWLTGPGPCRVALATCYPRLSAWFSRHAEGQNKWPVAWVINMGCCWRTQWLTKIVLPVGEAKSQSSCKQTWVIFHTPNLIYTQRPLLRVQLGCGWNVFARKTKLHVHELPAANVCSFGQLEVLALTCQCAGLTKRASHLRDFAAKEIACAWASWVRVLGITPPPLVGAEARKKIPSMDCRLRSRWSAEGLRFTQDRVDWIR